LKEIASCNEPLCVGSVAQVNCEWSDWGGWGVCNACHGEQKRIRQVKKAAARGGKQCDLSAAIETSTAGCSVTYMTGAFMRYCTAPAFCAWAEWNPWSECRANCGNSTRSRKRMLKVATLDTCSSFACVAPAVALADPASQMCRYSDGCTEAQCCSIPTTVPPTPPATSTVTSTTVALTPAPTPAPVPAPAPVPGPPGPPGPPRLYDAGTEEVSMDLNEVASMRKARIDNQGQMHMQELAMAFAAGGACIFLIFTAMRVYGAVQRQPEYEGVQMVDASRSEAEPMLGSSALE